MEVHEDRYKDLIEEGDTCGASDVLWSHLWGNSGGDIGKMDGLCVWVEM